MSERKLRYIGDPILRKKAKEIKNPEDKEIGSLIQDMIATMRTNRGAGLSANQVGLALRLIVVESAQGPLVLINPKIYHRSFKKETAEEGCLSIPGIYGLVKRAVSISFRARDLRGKKIKGKAKGLLARVIQHEVDHLNGVLFTDRTKKITKGTL